MKEKAVELIKKSHAIDENKKIIYLKLIKLIPEQDLADFVAILEKEQSRILELQEKSKQEESEFNRAYLEKISQIFKKGEQMGIQEEEKEDIQKGEDLLKQLDSL